MSKNTLGGSPSTQLDCCARARAMPQTSQDITLIRVNTDEGTSGVGTSIMGWGRSLEEFIGDRIGAALVALVGEAFAVERLTRILRLGSWLGPRLCPLEIALWDVIGKACNQPIYKLLGGYQDKVMAYASTAELKKPEERVSDVLKWREQGFQAVKIRAHHPNPQKDLEVVKAVRDAVGNDMEIMVDANMAWEFVAPLWSYQTAVKMAKEFEKLGVKWLEEPLYKDNLEALAKLAAEVDIPIAGGELEFGLFRFKQLIDKGAYDIVQPDVNISGGILEGRKISALAEASGRLCIPHTWTNGLGLAANLQLIGALTNCPYVEFPYEPPAWAEGVRDIILRESIKIDKNGFVEIPKKTGLGVELNEEVIAKYTYDKRVIP